MEKYSDYEKLCIYVNELLLAELKKIKEENKFKSWNAMFYHLLSMNNRPEILVKRYTRKFEDPNLETKTFEPNLSPKMVIKFRTWAAPFGGQTDALDYLISLEKKRNKFHFLDDMQV